MEGRDFSDVLGRMRLVVPIAWIGSMILLIYMRWGLIRRFALSDTDDNMRIMQVRGLLSGQGWYDLRQYRLDPPYGADMHWSRLVDLPIAGIKLLLAPLIGGRNAEQAAVALAPMLPMGVAIFAIALIARRLIDPKSLVFALLFLACAQATRGMWMPLRIDHHGWQLAFLALAMVGLTDPDKRRGGVIVGLATAASLTVGLEMLIYLAVAGGIVGLRWVIDGDRGRLAGYGVALGGGCAAGYLLFASYANRAPVCDALSPVWLSAMVMAGALCVGLALIRPSRWPIRLTLGAVAAALLAGFFIWAWPHCLGRLEGVSPRADELWLSRVREARPIYSQSWGTIAVFVLLPVGGLVGYAVMLWRHRRDAELFLAWASLALLAATGAALLLWQTRSGPPAGLLAVPGAAGVGWIILLALHRGKSALLRILGTVVAFLLLSGVGVQLAVAYFTAKPAANPRRMAQIGAANQRCPTMAALHPIALQPKGYVLTFVDLAPRLIAVTHHYAVAGPYHRNDDTIVDVMESFIGTPDHAREMIQRRRIDYVLICPNMSESTNYQVRAPKGFYAQLAKGQAPTWLNQIVLPKNSPYKMWRVAR